MATVRKRSSFAARKMRMAISLRLAASNLRIGFGFFISPGGVPLAKLYIVVWQQRQRGTVFSIRRIQILSEAEFAGGASHRKPRYGRGATVCRVCPEATVSGTVGADCNCKSWP